MFRTLLGILCLPALLNAQDEAKVSMKLDIVAWGDTIGGLSFKGGERDGKITAKAFTYSDPVNYNGPVVLALHQTGNGGADPQQEVSDEDARHQSVPLEVQKSDPEDAAGKLPPELAARREKDPSLVALIPLPTNSRRVTILLAPAAEGTYQGYVIDDDPSRLPAGKLRIHNLSPHKIALQFGNGSQAEMKRGDAILADAPGGQTIYRLAYQAGDQWKVQENNVVPVPPNQQTQLIVLKSDNQYFLSADGTAGGYLQTVVLRRDGRRSEESGS